MRYRSFLFVKILPYIYFLCLSGLIYGQTYTFRNYGPEFGMPNGFVYTINQSADGFLWAGTGDGLLRFDGYSYYNVEFPDSAISRNTVVSFRDNRGIIWFGGSDGSVFRSTGRGVDKVELPGSSRIISQILQGPDSLIYIIPQGEAVFRINPAGDEVQRLRLPAEYNIFSAVFDNAGKLMLGTQGAILFCNVEKDTLVASKSIDDFEYSGVSAIVSRGNGRYLAGTQGNGLFLLTVTGDSISVERFGDPGWSSLDVKSIFRDEAGRYYVSTSGNGVVSFLLDPSGSFSEISLYNSSTGLASDDVTIVYRDAEGNIWFGLFEKGLSMLASESFSFYRPGQGQQENNIIFTGKLGNEYILGTPSGFHVFDPVAGKSVSFTSLLRHTGGKNILSYHVDEEGNLLAGTDGNGLYRRNKNGNVTILFRSFDSGSDIINTIEPDDKGRIWLGTINGLILIDGRSGRMIKRFRTDETLPYNVINSVIWKNGKAYIGTTSDMIYYIDEELNVGREACVMGGTTRNKITGLSAGDDGMIWASTLGNGIFGCSGDSLFTVNRTNGLYTNYCYSILSGSRGSIWVGHAKGFSRIDTRSGSLRVFNSDYTNSGNCNPDAFYESPDGDVLIGTTEGLVFYSSAKDKAPPVPPVSNIVSVIIDDEERPWQPVINLPFGKYKIVIRYSGINFSDPENVYYRTFMENFDTGEEQSTVSREAVYNLSDGSFRFRVAAVDENGLASGQPAFLSINIAIPVYKKWWFILLLVALVAGIVSFIFWRREQEQKRIRIYLEEELKKRTATIVEQKNEIELQNIEITDSINYAKRIQTSVLPDVARLKEWFDGAFVIFHPRDIVSGDFYWFDKVDNDKYVVVCADSTGHGVPGAFMSMIGSTMLQDIVSRKKITQPSKVLSLLDKQIFSTLNQNMELGVSNDGMDMVVCEFNMSSRQLRFASAMRPVIIMHRNETLYVKGNRASVGGESVTDKYFDDQEYFLKPGDSIYLFSDGFPDQFGGTDGKKMKIARLKKTIEDVTALPMCEQEAAISKFFDQWRGGYEQVDDVLLMGIRL